MNRWIDDWMDGLAGDRHVGRQINESGVQMGLRVVVRMCVKTGSW